MGPEDTRDLRPDADLDSLIADYLQAAQAGKPPQQQELIARYPAFAQELAEFFADQERLLRVANPVREAMTGMPAPGTTLRYFGDYELIEEIARGGMGIVYKARQVSLNRVVALKMIARAELATAADVARFQSEAEAAASLDHPHIVPIYEIGEHEGQHYFSMKLITGESLAQRLAGARAFTTKSSVSILVAVARAVHYAHQRGVLHRDRKPANILLDCGLQIADCGLGSSHPRSAYRNPQSAIPTPFVTDFGLAKRVGADARLTQSGAVVGTPAYMAPEQARAEKRLSTAADVYALGAILYELLTGRPPFESDGVLETLRRVLEEEPADPRKRNPRADRDLATVALKCLNKDPAKRYGSAEALAEDLERWQRGEPILARPVGSVGRFSRWCRRNPVVAVLSGAVAAALVAGTVISTYFFIQADHRAAEEKAARERAEAAEDALEEESALGLIRTLDSTGGEVLREPEVEALWRLAGTHSERLRLRFLEEAIRAEPSASQLELRAEWFVHGAVGLDPQRRQRAEGLLSERMRDLDKSLTYRSSIACVVLELSEGDSPTQREAAGTATLGLAGQRNPNYLDHRCQVLLASANTIAPAEAATLVTQALAREKMDAGQRIQLAKGVVAAARRLHPADGARLLDHTFGHEGDAWVRQELAIGLAEVAGQLEPAEAARLSTAAVATLTQSLAQERDNDNRRALANGLAALTGRLEAPVAVRLLSDILAQERHGGIRWSVGGSAYSELAWGLVAAAGRLDPIEAAKLVDHAFAEEKDSDNRVLWASGLVAMAERLEPPEGAELLNKRFSQEGPGRVRRTLASGWIKATKRLPAIEAARLLNQVLAQERDAWVRTELATGLAAMVGRPEPAEAIHNCKEAVQLLSQALGQEKGSYYSGMK